MIIKHNREKLIYAIIYFAANTRHFHKTKLCKLLYFLDFEHFKQTGRSVTGLDYFAWPMGPVPVSIYNEIDNPSEDLAQKVLFQKTNINKGTMLEVVPLVPFESKFFTKRELRVMEMLAKEFNDTLADDMVEATHLENQPWHKIYNEQNKKQKLIPYDLAILKQEFNELQKISKERDELVNNFG
jgi:uncharacterized phage-associated protein